jgi:hypothetical protein
MHVVDLRSGQHVGNRDDPPKSAYFAVAAAARTADAPAQRSHLDGSTQQTPCCPPRCDDVRHRLPSRQFGNPPAQVQRRYKLGRSRDHGATAPEIKEPRLSLRAFNKRPGLRSQIADRKDLAPGAGPNSKSLARALARTPRAKLCCPVAGREALGSSAIERRDRRNFVGQIVQIERKNLIGWETAHQCIGDDIHYVL